MTGLNEAVQWQQVTCRRCKRTYQCTPEDDYYGTEAELPGPEGICFAGVCFSCLLILNGRDPETTRVLAIDEHGEEWDPRDLAVRENFEAQQDGAS